MAEARLAAGKCFGFGLPYASVHMLRYKAADIKFGALHYNKGASGAVVQGGTYEIAKAGGQHGAFYQTYVRRRSEEIRRGIRSKQRIQEHEEKLRNPGQASAGFVRLDPRQQRALIESKWPADISRLQEQKDILEGILRERGI
jgi:hypothetical protein